MKRIINYLSIIVALLFAFTINVKAENYKVYVDLDTLEYSINDKDYSSITEYKTLEEFLKDYNSDSLPSIYITNFLYDGVSTVKTPDLDDFIESDSNDTKIKTLEITVININTTGDIEFTGEITGAMIAVNTNNVKGNINIILNNASIDTDSKKAPAIFVYNKDKNYTDCIVTIKTVKGTKNYIEGGKLKKVSLIGSDELDKYSSYYSNTALTNYNKYSSYYGIYTSDEIENILFATVQADNEDLQDGDPYYFYKASGAISSDIDLYFEGEGFLSVTSKNKEGIETKGNLTFSGGTGDYEIYAQDDCLNTTTASSSGTNVRNDLTIDVHSLLASVSEDADEGDAIDSNGKLIINGGTIYAFAHPTSQDAGLDSGNGTYINGGTIIATGNMVDAISSDSEQNYLFASFQKITEDTLIVIKDQNDEIITAFKTGRSIQNILYSSSDLDYDSYKIYTGGTIDGDETNGLYTKVNSYTNGEEISFSNISNEMNKNNKNNDSNIILIVLISEIVLLCISIVVYILGRDKNSEMIIKEEIANNKSNVIYLISIAVLAAIVAVFWILIISSKSSNSGPNNNNNNKQGMNNNSSATYSSAKEITTNEDLSGGTYNSSTADENAISVSGKIESTLSDVTVTKTGDSDGGDNTSFYGTNSAVIAKDGATLTIDGATIATDATGANGVFSYGGSATTNNSSSDNTTVNISNSTITTSKDNSGGIMTTGGGIMNATNLTITTAGTSSAAIRSDRGGGTVIVDKGTYKTTGKGSPAVYSTADITVKNATLIATASEGIVIEGKNSVTLENVKLTDTNNTLNGQSTTYKNIFLYQSMSGDAADGEAVFTSKNSTITTNKGDSFYVTNTTATINLENNTIVNNDSEGNFLRIQKDSWGKSGSNGGDVTLNLTNQKVEGNIVVDSISKLEMNLTNGSIFKGSINSDNEGEVTLTLDKTSYIILTGDTYVKSLTNADSTNSNINLNGYKLYVNGVELK